MTVRRWGLGNAGALPTPESVLILTKLPPSPMSAWRDPCTAWFPAQCAWASEKLTLNPSCLPVPHLGMAVTSAFLPGYMAVTSFLLGRCMAVTSSLLGGRSDSWMQGGGVGLCPACVLCLWVLQLGQALGSFVVMDTGAGAPSCRAGWLWCWALGVRRGCSPARVSATCAQTLEGFWGVDGSHSRCFLA